MQDLFHCTCPTCGQLMPESAPPQKTGFAEFWAKAPNKVAKVQARKTWDKMTTAQRQAASENVTGWYAWFQRTYREAGLPHPATYLAQRRWEDEGWQPSQASTVDKAAFWAESIKAGRYVSPATCNAALCREMIDRGLVSKREVLEKGLSI